MTGETLKVTEFEWTGEITRTKTQNVDKTKRIRKYPV